MSNHINSLFSQLPIKPAQISELLNFMTIIRNNNIEVDFWVFQNTWYKLDNMPSFMDNLNKEEKSLFMELGIILTFCL
jgi:hypothetical protein